MVGKALHDLSIRALHMDFAPPWNCEAKIQKEETNITVDLTW